MLLALLKTRPKPLRASATNTFPNSKAQAAQTGTIGPFRFLGSQTMGHSHLLEWLQLCLGRSSVEISEPGVLFETAPGIAHGSRFSFGWFYRVNKGYHLPGVIGSQFWIETPKQRNCEKCTFTNLQAACLSPMPTSYPFGWIYPKSPELRFQAVALGDHVRLSTCRLRCK